MKNDDKWLKQIKAKVGDIQESPPPMLWAKIAEDPAFPIGKAKVIPFYKQPRNWWMAAALLVGVSTVALFLQREETEMLGETPQKVYVAQDSYLEEVTQELNEGLEPSVKIDQSITTSVAKGGKSLGLSPAMLATASHQESELGTALKQKVEATTQEDSQEPNVASQQQESTPRVYDDLYAHLRGNNSSSTTEFEQGKSSIGLHAGGAGRLVGGDVSGVQTQSFYKEVDLGAFVNPAGYEPMQKYQMVIKDGVPYIKDEVNVNKYKHNQPISFGLNYSYSLNKHLALESGLIYTYLSSDVKEVATGRSYKQKFHYLGIPIKLYWGFLQRNRFSLYTSGGGMIELAVAGRVDGRSQRPTRPQFSVLGGVGAQYAISKVFGFYIEPGVAYYFKNGSKIETIRTEKPFNFNLNAGVRLTF